MTYGFLCLPKQYEFLESTADEVLFSGAYGAGKTVSLCVKLLSRAMRPGAREGLFRLNLQDLYSTTLKTLLEGDGDMPPLLPPHLREWNQARREVRIAGGGTIIYGEADPDKIQGMNLTGAGVDQAEELDERQWNAIAGRLRAKVGDLPRQLYAACNPGPPTHHLAKRFGIRGNVAYPADSFSGDARSPIRCHAVMTHSAENPHLPPDYMARLASYSGVLRARYVLGMWVGSDALVYDRWNRATHLRDRRDALRWPQAFILVDDAYSVPFAALLAFARDDGAMHVAAEVHRPQMLEQEKVEAIRELAAQAGERLAAVVVDPAAAALKARLRAEGFKVEDGQNEPVTGGIFEVQQLLAATDRDGVPMLTVAAGCTKTAEEFEAYEWADSATEKPVKEHDHAMDALRYGVMRIRRPAATFLDAALIRKLRAQAQLSPPPATGELRAGVEKASVELEVRLKRGKLECSFAAAAGGAWRVWAPLKGGRLDQQRPYVVAVSVGSGTAGSATVIKVGDAESRRVVAQADLVGVAPEEAAREAVAACWWVGGRTGKPMLVWKAAGPGVLFGVAVRRLGYGAVYRHIKDDGTRTDDPGWKHTAAGSHALAGRFRGDVERDRYVEADAATAADLARWVFHPSGACGPVSLDTDGETLAGASDRGWAAVLLAHAFPLVERLGLAERQAEWGSIAWLRQSQSHGGAGGDGSRK